MKNAQVVLVTGASSGIGKATVDLCAGNGCRVFAAARNAPASCNGFTFFSTDVRDDQSVQSCARRVLQEAGRIDVLVNCAGVVVGGPVEEMLDEEVMDQIQTNLLGTMRMCRAVLPAMRGQRSGLIINVGSLAGLMGIPFQAAYSASKHGIEGFSESLQMEIKGFGIRVVVVDPGDVATEITAHRKLSRASTMESPYAASFNKVMASQSESERRGWQAERVARFLGRIMKSRAPRFRYTPGPLVERISPSARRLIPDRLFLRILAGFYRL